MERRIRLKTLNPHITCKICGGYFIDATTVTECLHTFCKSCLVKHLEENNTCPSCEIVIHQSHPLQYISYDRTMQDIVFKLVPGLQTNEIKREREFYKKRGLPYPKNALGLTIQGNEPGKIQRASNGEKEHAGNCGAQASSSKEEDANYHRTDEQVNILLESQNNGSLKPMRRKFIRCSAQATITHLKKFIAKKLYNNLDKYKEVDILCNEEILGKDHTLKFVCVTRWRFKSDIRVTEDLFGRLKSDDGNEEIIRRFTLENRTGMSVQLINYGATITSIKVLDKNGNVRDVVLGFDTVEEYVNCRRYFGATIGRFCNRIAGGSFRIGSREIRLNRNENENHLHGGNKGFDKMVWEASIEENSVVFLHRSLSRHENYPGDLTARVIYSLNAENELRIDYRVTDITELTPINLTNHSYFNLNGHDSGCIANHLVEISSNFYLPTDSKSIPTGEIRSVEGTRFDLRSGVKLNQLEKIPGGGYDHNFCLVNDENEEAELKTVATVYEESSGIALKAMTNQPGVQFYTSNFLPSDDSLRGKGTVYRKHSAFCLETQNYPDAVNKEHFPSCFYGPGDTYDRTTVYRFTNGIEN